MAREYRKRKRAELEAETRSRIIEATIELHQTIGPTATTVSEIAERAGVGRVTVYRHFPDEPTLSRACSGLYMQRHPLPDPDRWLEVSDLTDRLRYALAEVYAYHRANEAMFSHVLADARDHEVMKPYHAHWQRAADILVTASRVRGRRRTLLRAGIGLALSFDTWRALARDYGLSDTEAVDVALRLVCDSSGDPTRRS